MYLLYAVLCLCLAGLWLRAVNRGIRYPTKPFWINETFVLYVAAPLISGLAALGAVFALRVLATSPPTLLECAYSFALIAAAAGLDLYFSRGSRQSTKASSAPAGRLINADFGGTEEHNTPHPAQKPDQGHKKAA